MRDAGTGQHVRRDKPVPLKTKEGREVFFKPSVTFLPRREEQHVSLRV